MKRLDILDGMRGYFLVFMMLNHMSFAGGYLLVKINHGELGYVQDAQGFVFLSGLLIGMVYAGHMAKRGYDPAAAKIRARSFELYRWAIGCVLAVVALGLILPWARSAWEPWLWGIQETPLLLLAASATLLYQPTYMDILPQYIVYLMLAPPVLWLCVTGRWRLVALCSALLWMAVQFGLHLPIADALHGGLQAIHPSLALRAHFNVLAWQVLFFGGMVLGALAATGQVDWRETLTPERPEFALASLAVLVFFLGWRMGFTYGLVPDALGERFFWLDTRGEFSFVYLLNFTAIAYLVAWTLIAGPRSQSSVVQVAARALTAVFTLPFLQLIGRHSLQVYVWHVIVVYLVKAIDVRYGAFGEASKTAIAFTAVASLALPALWREWRAAAPQEGARTA